MVETTLGVWKPAVEVTEPSGGHRRAREEVQSSGGRMGPVPASAEGTKCPWAVAGAVAGLQPPVDPVQEPPVCPWRGWG